MLDLQPNSADKRGYMNFMGKGGVNMTSTVLISINVLKTTTLLSFAGAVAPSEFSDPASDGSLASSDFLSPVPVRGLVPAIISGLGPSRAWPRRGRGLAEAYLGQGEP